MFYLCSMSTRRPCTCPRKDTISGSALQSWVGLWKLRAWDRCDHLVISVVVKYYIYPQVVTFKYLCIFRHRLNAQVWSLQSCSLLVIFQKWSIWSNRMNDIALLSQFTFKCNIRCKTFQHGSVKQTLDGIDLNNCFLGNIHLRREQV